MKKRVQGRQTEKKIGQNTDRRIFDGAPNVVRENWDFFQIDEMGKTNQILPLINGPFLGFYKSPFKSFIKVAHYFIITVF